MLWLFASAPQARRDDAQEGQGQFGILFKEFGQVPGRQSQAGGWLLGDDVGHARSLVEYGEFTEEISGSQAGDHCVAPRHPGLPGGDEIETCAHLSLAHDVPPRRELNLSHQIGNLAQRFWADA